MTTYREGHSLEPFPSSSSETSAAEHSADRSASPVMPDGWRRIPSGQRDARLYRVAPRASGAVYWVIEITLNGNLLQRRFASELHARAWLVMACEPLRSRGPDGFERLNGFFRSACVDNLEAYSIAPAREL